METVTMRRAVLPPEERKRVGAVARRGGSILFPTESFYALGVDPFSNPAVEKVFLLKGRPPDQPLLVLIDGPERLPLFAAVVPGEYPLLMRRFWPGPLTLLFPALPSLPGGIVSPSGSVALRVPGSPVCRQVLAAAGGCLTGTSANRSGGDPPREVGQAAASLLSEPDLAVDGGTLPGGMVSTLLEIRRGRAAVLREGAVPSNALRECLSD